MGRSKLVQKRTTLLRPIWFNLFGLAEGGPHLFFGQQDRLEAGDLHACFHDLSLSGAKCTISDTSPTGSA